jgi:octaprenyl-diphosphate synthase
MRDVFKHYEKDLNLAESHIEKMGSSCALLAPKIADHIVKSGGKRLRPLLVILSSDLCGYRSKHIHSLAAAIEFVHTASLLHDDVIDHADIRRGNATANKIWGNHASVLAGDYLFAKFFDVLTDEDFRIQKLLSAAVTTMVEGEVLQSMRCGDTDITENDYLSIIERKTAALISAACASGAVLAKAAETKIEKLAAFGTRLGMAYQITDDILDYRSEEARFGKSMGMDIKEGKITLPLIKVFKESTDKEKGLIEKFIKEGRTDSGSIAETMSLIDKYGGIEYATEKAREYAEKGRVSLDLFENSMSKEALLTVLDHVVVRKS